MSSIFFTSSYSPFAYPDIEPNKEKDIEIDFGAPSSDFSTAKIESPMDTEKSESRASTPSKKRKSGNITRHRAKKRKLNEGGRVIIPLHRAPCTKQPLEIKQAGGCDELSLKTHAYLRIQALVLAVIAYYGTKRRSSPSKTRSFFIQTEHSYLQTDKAISIKPLDKNVKPFKYHQAHYNISNVGDNYLEVILQEAADELNVTPNTQRFLKIKNLLDIVMKYIKNPTTMDELKAAIKQVCPLSFSVLTCTDTEIMLNGTTEVRVAVNEVIDKGVECHIDNLYIEVLEEVTHHPLPPRDEPAYQCEPMINACKKIHGGIRKFFSNRINVLTKHAALLKEYEIKLIELVNYKSINQEELFKSIEEMQPLIDKMMDSNLSEDDTVNEDHYKTKIMKNKKFIKQSLDDIHSNKSYRLNSFNTWMRRKYDLLKIEVSEQIKKIDSYIKYMTLELEGTQLYSDKDEGFEDYDFFKAFLGSKESIAEIQERLWKPLDADSPILHKIHKKFKVEDLRPRKLEF